jgi:hypothetical protein
MQLAITILNSEELEWNITSVWLMSGSGEITKKYVPVILNGLIRVDGGEMPTGRVIGFGNFIRGF